MSVFNKQMSEKGWKGLLEHWEERNSLDKQWIRKTFIIVILSPCDCESLHDINKNNSHNNLVIGQMILSTIFI